MVTIERDAKEMSETFSAKMTSDMPLHQDEQKEVSEVEALPPTASEVYRNKSV